MIGWGADPVALPLFAASARAAVVVPRCPWNLQAGRSDRCGVPGFIDGWLVFWCSFGRGNYPPFTPFGVFLAGLGGMFAVNGIVSFLSSRESGGPLWAGSRVCVFSNPALYHCYRTSLVGPDSACEWRGSLISLPHWS